MNFKKTLKSIVYPVTVLSVITLLSIIVSVYALYVSFTHSSEFGIYVAVLIPISIILILFYIIDRFLVKKVTYYKLIIAELIIGVFIFLLISFLGSSTNVNFHTSKDYILVIFDANEDSISKFNKKGLFGKELNIYNTNKVHLNKTMCLIKNLKINNPKDWKGVYYTEGTYVKNSDSIKYIYVFKLSEDANYQKVNFVKHSKVYIDSLIRQEIK
ncbi:hypothetical protein [Lutibacter sp.]|uniref:hypothetical protein n=1 Tax=Lutibacter sp. TaxID=1925666 RepID=UPI0035650FDF